MADPVRLDDRIRKRGTIAAATFAACMLAVGASLAGVILIDKDAPGHQWFEAATCPALLGVFGASALVAHFFFRVRIRYRCPKCGVRLPRLPEREPKIQYQCDACHVIWDTGWHVADD